MKLTPKSWWDQISAAELPFEVLIGICTVVTALFTGLAKLTESPPKYEFGFGSIGTGAVLCVVLLWRAVYRNRNEREKQTNELHALDGALHTLHTILLFNGRQFERPDLRICVYVPHPDNPEHVHQLTNYVCDGDGRGRGRNISVRCGIVGRALRSGQAHFDKLPQGQAMIDYLVNSYGYDRQEAAAMNRDRKSWAAIPIGEPGKVVAVIYLDSAEADFFGNVNQPRRKNLEFGAIGVARFVTDS